MRKFLRLALPAVDGLNVLASPACYAALEWREAEYALRCTACHSTYPIRQSIPDFTEPATLTCYNRRFARFYDRFSWFYRLFSRVAFAYLGMSEASVRRDVWKGWLYCLEFRKPSK